MIIGFGFGWLMIAVDEMLTGFSCALFQPPPWLCWGTVVALLIDRSGLFEYVSGRHHPLVVRLGPFPELRLYRNRLSDAQQQRRFFTDHSVRALRAPNQTRQLVITGYSVIIDGRIGRL